MRLVIGLLGILRTYLYAVFFSGDLFEGSGLCYSILSVRPRCEASPLCYVTHKGLASHRNTTLATSCKVQDFHPIARIHDGTQKTELHSAYTSPEIGRSPFEVSFVRGPEIVSATSTTAAVSYTRDICFQVSAHRSMVLRGL